jgi:hypothetical protein
LIFFLKTNCSGFIEVSAMRQSVLNRDHFPIRSEIRGTVWPRKGLLNDLKSCLLLFHTFAVVWHILCLRTVLFFEIMFPVDKL